MRGREFLPLSARVLDLAVSGHLSAYDSEYVALAEELNLSLVTSDQRVIEAFTARAISPADFLASDDG